ncbi:pca operon transcription factor PcaQ [Puniceibacterium sediminis]|uniref:LysR family transcriptional regulator, pca operon transcriptional activator n=1 Tax=Puniceibacterium sediminis TaxID=1608407 RepID=A0A238UR95_9RHOB|nr:pca operon transcription factor PcaQ [Puniceibacterium sediminis]SNR24471.1 LysR family transcriptional regulator, pca operon transcriptional activator [Puniceibacterium sediminis]
MIDRRIKFRHIECFAAIHRQGSLKRACAVLNLTQPALSKTLKELEEILGVTLMSRDRGGVRLTPEGRVFLEFAEMSLAALRRGVDGVTSLRESGGAVLRVGALPSVAARLLPQAVARFRAQAPDVVLDLQDGAHGHLTEQLRSGSVDLVIGRLGAPETMTGLSFTQLYLERVVFVVRPGHPLLERGALDLTAIADWPVIHPPADAAIRPLVDRTLIAQGVPPLRDRIETVSGAFGRNYVRQSDAIWIISEGVVAQDMTDGRLSALPLDTGLTAGPVGLMIRPDDPPSPARQIFVTALEQAAATIRTDAGGTVGR